jgi:hypothetical protein
MLPVDPGADPPRPSIVVAAAGRFVRDAAEFAPRTPAARTSGGGTEPIRRPS